MMVTLFWWQNFDIGDIFWMLVPDANVKRYRILVAKTTKTAINISKLSPKNFVSNIRHQHRCSNEMSISVWESTRDCMKIKISSQNYKFLRYLWILIYLEKIRKIPKIWKFQPSSPSKMTICSSIFKFRLWTRCIRVSPESPAKMNFWFSSIYRTTKTYYVKIQPLAITSC